MTAHVYNDRALKHTRRNLRAEATPQECMMWSRLKSSQLGVRFRRQHSVGRYILDFYCPSHKLAIEIDGSQHLDRAAHDTERSAYLNKRGIRVVRFGNNEVNSNMEGVMSAILEAIDECTSPSPLLCRRGSRWPLPLN